MMVMSALPVVYLARHGETAWTVSRQHTGVTDLPLTAQGEVEARQLGERLGGVTFAGVPTSPLGASVRACHLARFVSASRLHPDPRVWDSCAYRTPTTTDVRN